jgi:peptidoglycan/LPS O-acetylase OafA/YrhL
MLSWHPADTQWMRRIPLLDGWRAIAIALVLAHHIGQNLSQNEGAYNADVTRYGAFGVDIFFGLSGLLITRLLLEQYRASGSFGLREFYIRRAFRILPTCLLFLAVYSALGWWKSSLEFVSSVFFFRNYIPETMAGFGSGHLWSLSVEEHFYLIWPGLLAFLAARRSKNVAAGLALGFGLWRMIESQLTVHMFPLSPAHFRTDLRLDALLWGCVAAFVLDNSKERDKFAAQFRLPMFAGAALVLILSVRFYSVLTSVWIAALIPGLLAGTLVHPEWWISRLLGWAPVTWLGRISYSLYLWQQLFFPPGWEQAPQWWRHWPANLLLAFAAASLSYYLVEKPLIAMGRRYANIRFPASIFKYSMAAIKQSPAVIRKGTFQP